MVISYENLLILLGWSGIIYFAPLLDRCLGGYGSRIQGISGSR